MKRRSCMMYNHEFERPAGDSMPNTFEQQYGQDWWLWLAGGLSVVFAAVAGVLLVLARRRRPTRLERAEASLVAAATRAEQAARTVRKQGPAVVVKSGTQVEQWGRMLRKRGPAFLERSADRVEQAARNVRKQAPSMVANSASRAEQAARIARKQGPAKL